MANGNTPPGLTLPGLIDQPLKMLADAALPSLPSAVSPSWPVAADDDGPTVHAVVHADGKAGTPEAGKLRICIDDDGPGLPADARAAVFARGRWGRLVRVTVQPHVNVVVIKLFAPQQAGQRLAVMDIGAAQWRLNRLGQLSRVDLKLRDGVEWNDGQKFTADDVKFTLERAGNVPNSPSSFSVYTRPVREIEIVDPLTLRLAWTGPVWFLMGARMPPA